MYKISFADRVQEDLERLSAHEPAAFNKVVKMLNELAEHPRTGTGHPEPLKGQPEGRWSRRITKKHRLVYRIFDDTVLVLVLRAYGHYDDK